MSRIEDPQLLKQLHLRWLECVLCLGTKYSEGRLSLHHVHRHPRDDVQANLVMLCGSGTTGCHGLVEAHNAQAMSDLGFYLSRYRPDVIAYLTEKLGGEEARKEWMTRQFGG